MVEDSGEQCSGTHDLILNEELTFLFVGDAFDETCETVEVTASFDVANFSDQRRWIDQILEWHEGKIQLTAD